MAVVAKEIMTRRVLTVCPETKVSELPPWPEMNIMALKQTVARVKVSAAPWPLRVPAAKSI